MNSRPNQLIRSLQRMVKFKPLRKPRIGIPDAVRLVNQFLYTLLSIAFIVLTVWLYQTS